MFVSGGAKLRQILLWNVRAGKALLEISITMCQAVA